MDEDSVDISGVASKINQKYGINIREEKLAGILLRHRLILGAKLAGYPASPIQINPNPQNIDVAGHLLLLHENSTLISGITDAVAASHVPPTGDCPTLGITAEELPPPVGKVIKELHFPIGVVHEELLPPVGVVTETLSSPNEVVDEKVPYQGVFMEQVATLNLNNTTTRSNIKELDPMVEGYKQDQV